MATIYNQALAHRFGVALSQLLESGDWSTIQTAVAWVRRSGTRHLLPSLKTFLRAGGKARFTVGVDIENTSKEGLEDLLSLNTVGDSKTYVHHNESHGVTFHPKIYLLTNDTNARLIIGSNNLTESGLFTNTEVSLQIDALPSDQVIVDIQKALDAWSDTSEDLSKELDQGLLDALVKERYIFPEQSLLSRIAKSRSARNGGPGGTKPLTLFGKRSVSAPPPPRESGSGPGTPPPPPKNGRKTRQRKKLATTSVLLMRLRPSRQGKQVQIPIPIRESAFLRGVTDITSGHAHKARVISAAKPERSKKAKRPINTYKIEVPEALGKQEPVMRLERSQDGITYYVYDASTPQGRIIKDALEQGRHTSPPQTILTKTDPQIAQWYRFV